MYPYAIAFEVPDLTRASLSLGLFMAQDEAKLQPVKEGLTTGVEVRPKDVQGTSRNYVISGYEDVLRVTQASQIGKTRLYKLHNSTLDMSVTSTRTVTS